MRRRSRRKTNTIQRIGAWVPRLVFAAAVLGASFAAGAQAPVRLGVLVQEMGRGQSQAITGMSGELKRLGYRERSDFVLDTRNVKGNRAGLQPAAQELIALKVKLIFTTGTSATRSAMGATADIPVLFVHAGDPAASGLLKNNDARPKNLAGVAAYAPHTTERRLVLFKQILPALRKILVFFDANNAVSREYFKMAEAAARKLGIEAAVYPIKSADELKTTFASLQPESGVGIFQISDELVEGEAEFLFETARAKKIASMFNEESWAIAGALAAYGPNYLEMGGQAGRLADKIIKGSPPISLPLERASKFDFTLNYRTARFIGVQLTPEMIRTADKVIR